ncbi:MAG TPA: hydantoinase/oxoprolinase family protein [Solirubrobacterales bacterium]|jgi:N-methylhydantoinase A|nr:hydantoinase/oxoprolinase family protein [Solirubrobacterales bacterium]
MATETVASANGTTPTDAYIGVDVGGTHTDVAAVVGGSLRRGKALTTYDDFSKGVLDAVAVAAENHGLSREELLSRTRLFINGTTVVTNAITTLNGSRVGVVVTAGFKDTFRFAGGPRIAEIDDHLQVNAPDIVDRAAIGEIDERTDWSGEVLAPLDLEGLRREVERLVSEQGVSALAICFMNSFANPANELAALKQVKEDHPDLFVTLSHEVFPVRGENRRWTTAVLNSFVQEEAESYLASLTDQLRAAGLGGGMAFFQGLGGGISRERAGHFPLSLIGSGPAGGAIGANALAERMGISNVLLGDMGGTSFDTGIIVDNTIRVTKNVDIGLLHSGVNIVDVVSVGAGGGSIASVGDRGVPEVGPASAKSDPGPVAYGRGGTDPTVTDAMIAMGIIDPERYLGGRFTLRPDLAGEAIDERFGERFGWTTKEAAAAIHDLVVVNMANAVREVSVQQGHDPREFMFLAYGGTLPLFAMQIARQLGIGKVVVPQNSSVFCALGLLSSDFVMRYDRTVAWDLSDAEGVAHVNEVAEEMIGRAVGEMEGEGFGSDQITVTRLGDFRFLGQSYELTAPLPDRALTPDDAPVLAREFFELYEHTYGEGTAWKGVPEQLQTVTVIVTGRGERPAVDPLPHDPRPAAEIERGRREVFLPTEREPREVPIYADEKFSVGSVVSGPAIVDATDTTIYVPPGTTARRDEYMNYVLEEEGGSDE